MEYILYKFIRSYVPKTKENQMLKNFLRYCSFIFENNILILKYKLTRL